MGHLDTPKWVCHYQLRPEGSHVKQKKRNGLKTHENVMLVYLDTQDGFHITEFIGFSFVLIIDDHKAHLKRWQSLSMRQFFELCGPII